MTLTPVRAVIFDLDGTLVQTRVASWEIFSRISDRFDLGVTRPEEYFDLFRANLFASIRTLCRDEAHAAEVKDAFLTLLRNDYTPPLVPGMADVVRRLAGDCTLAVMSSNAMQVLRRVLVTNDLAFCFAHVFGGDVAPDKRAAIRAFLADSGSGFGRRCTADYDEAGRQRVPDLASTVLVTDTAGDVRDALAAGIRVVGVAWGMHTVDELTDAGAEFVALWPQEVSAHLLGDAAADPPGGACALGPTGDAGPQGPGRDERGGGRDAPEPPPRSSRPHPATGCGCGCSGPEPVATPRRERRRAAAAAARGAGSGAAELLDAVRRVCGRG